MLSIIICHRNIQLFTALQSNIETTAGIPYELVVIDNTQNKHSIFSAYNEGVKKARYDLVCFAHEDIEFFTNNWGHKVVAHFNDAEVGMIGVIGGMAQSAVPSPWWLNNHFDKSGRNLLMRSPNNKLYQYYSNPYTEPNKTSVVIIDGVWFCIRKELFKKISFDENFFTGFHLYDADISMQVLRYAKNFVVFDILIEHKWNGKISKDYYPELCRFATKWEECLPIQNEKIEKGYMKNYNWYALRNLILEMKKNKIEKQVIHQTLNKYYPVAKANYNSRWFKGYFFISRVLGYRFTNSVFFRIERLFGYGKTLYSTVKFFDRR